VNKRCVKYVADRQTDTYHSNEASVFCKMYWKIYVEWAGDHFLFVN